MIIGGIQKNSLIDYPEKISCVIFTSGCNFTCPYCHNPELAKNNTKVNKDHFKLRADARRCNNCKYAYEGLLERNCIECKYSGNTIAEAELALSHHI